MCEQCNVLRLKYRATVDAYLVAVRRMSGALGSDFKILLEEAERLQAACRSADHQLNQHWQVEHAWMYQRGSKDPEA